MNLPRLPTADFSYAAHGPRRFADQAGSYALPETITEHHDTAQYALSLGEIVTAAIATRDGGGPTWRGA